MQRQKSVSETGEGDNGVPKDVTKCRGSNSPAPTIPEIRGILLPSFLYCGYLQNQIYFGNNQENEEMWTARSSGPTLSL